MPTSRPLLPLLLFALSLLPLADDSDAAVYAVGAEPGCTHATIQAAIDAAEASPGEDFIRIPHSRTWSNSALVIDTSQRLALEGFWSDCNTIDGSTRSVIDGAGGPRAPVLEIRGGSGSVISLNALTIRGGDAWNVSLGNLSGDGGGIRYDGSGVLHISDSGISNNEAARGGGIFANGSVESARLVIGANVTVAANVAQSDGGGVFVNGMQFSMEEPNSIIAFNQALGLFGTTGYGGGLVLRSPAGRAGLAYVSSGGVGSLGAIHGNEAKRGGGVAVSAGSESKAYATLYFYSTQPDQPSAIRGNFASEKGGAIYLWPNRNLQYSGSTSAILRHVELTDNAAPDGAALFLDNSSITVGTEGAAVYMGPQWNIGPVMPPVALPCPIAAACVRILGNSAVDAANMATDGALIVATDESFLRASSVLIADNHTGRILAGDSEDVDVLDSLIVDNHVRRELIDMDSVTLVESTVAGNSIVGEHLLRSSGATISGSILWQPGKVTRSAGGSAPTVSSVIASEVASIGGGPNAIVASPRFVDPDQADFRLRDYGLRAASPGIDLLLPVTGDDRDALGLPRDRRIDAVPRLAGHVRDVGALERQALLPILLNGEFGEAGGFVPGANHWQPASGPEATYVRLTENAPGSPASSAALQVHGASSTGRLLGVVQCVHLPGPGTYLLNGYGRSSGDDSQTNIVGLIWELRADGGEGCVDGPISESALHHIGRSGGYVTGPPTLINVPAALWNHDTSLTVLTVVLPNAAADGQYNGVFDRITLSWTAIVPAALFSDGFEAL
jgi:hypothetical protein